MELFHLFHVSSVQNHCWLMITSWIIPANILGNIIIQYCTVKNCEETSGIDPSLVTLNAQLPRPAIPLGLAALGVAFGRQGQSWPVHLCRVFNPLLVDYMVKKVVQVLLPKSTPSLGDDDHLPL